MWLIFTLWIAVAILSTSRCLVKTPTVRPHHLLVKHRQMSLFLSSLSTVSSKTYLTFTSLCGRTIFIQFYAYTKTCRKVTQSVDDTSNNNTSIRRERNKLKAGSRHVPVTFDWGDVTGITTTSKERMTQRTCKSHTYCIRAQLKRQWNGFNPTS